MKARLPRPPVTLVAASLLVISGALPARAQREEPAPRAPDFERMARDQTETDRRWREAAAGFMQVEKITYMSRGDHLEIPAFVFQPLTTGAPKSQAALVWVHENIRGHLYEHYIPYIREATARGYVVIAPEYRGSVGYGRALYDAIDYGGAEVDDVATGAAVIASKYSRVDPARIGIIGWSHGGMMALLAVARNPGVFRAVAALQPVTNLFQRLAWKGIERQRQAIDPKNRFGGTPAEKRDVYKDRSPLFQVDKLEIPVLVHLAGNDDDVNIEEGMQLVDALRARKPQLADTAVYPNPPGGHMFDRRVNAGTWDSVNAPEQRDSWARVWAFLERNLLIPPDAHRHSSRSSLELAHRAVPLHLSNSGTTGNPRVDSSDDRD